MVELGACSHWSADQTRDQADALPRDPQDPNQRYVQLAIGHGNVRVEATSNTYLTGDFRLSPAEEDRLCAVGFQSPWDEVEHEYARPRNWWLMEPIGLPVVIAELVTHTLIRISAFDVRHPVTITMFGADRPCKECSWS